MTEAVLSPLPKVDPETLAIRAKPARAIRFRRGVIIAIAALGSVSLMAVAWIALKPRVCTAVASGQELSQPSNRPSTDALNGLPATYGDTPKLGPPLPGDLGRPILESQRRMATETGVSGDPSAQTAAQTAAQERERRLAELKAARESAVLVQGRTAATATASPDTAVTAAPAAVGATPPALDPDRDPNAQGRKAQFVAALDRSGDVNAHRLTAAPSPSLLTAGSVISASLITGLRSDLPGLVTAQVTSAVFDILPGASCSFPKGRG